MKQLVEWLRAKLFMAGLIDGPEPVQGELFAKVTTSLPREKWSVWKIDMIHHDFNDIPTAVLSDVKQPRSQRSIALEQLRNPDEWQKVARVSESLSFS
jgi:hypothetical protein